MLFDRAQSIKQIEAAQKIEAVETARKDQAAHAYKEALAAQMEIVEEKKREARKRMTIETNAEKVRVELVFVNSCWWIILIN